MRLIFESALNQQKADSMEVAAAEKPYMQASAVLQERLKAGEKFNDNTTSREHLTALYQAMDFDSLGDLTAQFRSIYASLRHNDSRAEKILWERRLMCAQNVLNERQGERQIG